MNQELTDYEKDIFSKLNTITINKTYQISPDRSDLSDFMKALDKYSTCFWNCLLIDKTGLKFKRVWTVNTPEWCKENNVKHWSEELVETGSPPP